MMLLSAAGGEGLPRRAPTDHTCGVASQRCRLHAEHGLPLVHAHYCSAHDERVEAKKIF
jgi:hypothetical protein